MASRKRKQTDAAPNVITMTRKGTVVHFGNHQQMWRGFRFERRSRLSRWARAVIADAKRAERASHA